MKNKFIKTSINVIFLGLMAKILSLIVKIYTTRTYGISLMSVYSLVSPLMMFIIVLVQLSLPLAISKLVSQKNTNKNNYLISAYTISLSISLLIMILLIILSKPIAINIFKNIDTKHSIMAIGVYAPLVTITSIYKGYLIGNNKIIITSFSQIIEEIARLLFILITSAFFISKNTSYASMGIIVGMWIGEIFQMISLVFTNYKKNFNFKKIINKIISVNEFSYKELLNISIPITLSKIITSFSYSLEPIIFTNISLSRNISSEEITRAYGVIQSYVNPILFLPSFFISSISLMLLPTLSKLFHNRNIKKSKELFLKTLLLSFIIGFVSSCFIFIFSKNILKIMFKTDLGLNYIKLLAFPYVLYYIESILNTTLHCINKEKLSLSISVISSIIRILLLYIFIPIYGVIGIEYAMLLSVLIIIVFDSFIIKKYLFNNRQTIL